MILHCYIFVGPSVHAVARCAIAAPEYVRGAVPTRQVHIAGFLSLMCRLPSPLDAAAHTPNRLCAIQVEPGSIASMLHVHMRPMCGACSDELLLWERGLELDLVRTASERAAMAVGARQGTRMQECFPLFRMSLAPPPALPVVTVLLRYTCIGYILYSYPG